MSSSISENKKRGRGRPATGFDPAVSSRLPVEIIAALDSWAAKKGITRGEAVRMLVERGLKAPKRKS